MNTYQEALQGLNEAQRQAVTTLEGPVLVIAGPGTGKTQLLTTRIAHILQTTDTLPENILCLTFTESAAQTMRERLANLIGQAAYDITISTYHAFGSDLIRRYPDHFIELADMRPVDDLGIDAIFREILQGLPFSNPLKFADLYLADIKTLVSDAKRALLAPADLRAVAKDNDVFLATAQPIVAEHLRDLVRIDKKSIPRFANIAAQLAQEAAKQTPSAKGVTPLAQLLLQELHDALADAETTGKTNAITKWKNVWLAKDAQGQFVVDGRRTNLKLRAAADVYEQYLTELAARGLFDYDDMILRAVHALETHTDLRFTLQEKYLYLLLDEFQDTNGAQLRLVQLLTDNPVSEGRPNVLAVGDDDQAIYAFQGANYSHMLQFQQMYRDVLVVPLIQNYRSHADILYVARGIAEQIEERLHHHFPQIEKTLTAAAQHLPAQAVIERREAKSDVGQFGWTAKRVKELLEQGTRPSEIAVLAPQHKYLEPLVPFLQAEGIPVRYEKRENVLDDPAINQLLRMSELCLALASGQHARADALWAEVLSFAFWRLPTSLVWQLSWQASDDQEHWTEVLLQHPDLRPTALFFIRLSMLVGSETLEALLDYLIGMTPLPLEEPGIPEYQSPFYAHYFGDLTTPTTNLREAKQPSLFDDSEGDQLLIGNFWELLTNLTVLRSRLREYMRAGGEEEPLRLPDFITFVEAHRAANIKVLNTSPYQEAAEAVQLMTAFKAKGMEFDAVFVLAVNDEAWGNSARTQSSRLSLPQNLHFIRYAGATNDERLRLFYVAITRARQQLYLVNYTSNYAGKRLTRLKYLSETTSEQGAQSPLLPLDNQLVQPAGDVSVAPKSELSAYWHQRHQAALTQADLRHLLRHRLERFQLSPTHVNAFIDLIQQGPAYFYMNTILRFPRAPTPTGEFGNAMHEILEWIHVYHRQHQRLPSTTHTLEVFATRLRAKHLNERDAALFLERGQTALSAYLQQRGHTIAADNEAEFNFRNEGVFIDKAHLAGKIDKLIIDKVEKTIQIVDYKTGKSYHRWAREPKLHRYRQQLYLYKALVEKSHSFAGYTVTDAYLEFVEPDEDGLIQELHLRFDAQETAEAQRLAIAIWQCVMGLEIPDIADYTPDLAGIEAFEQDLISRYVF